MIGMSNLLFPSSKLACTGIDVLCTTSLFSPSKPHILAHEFCRSFAWMKQTLTWIYVLFLCQSNFTLWGNCGSFFVGGIYWVQSTWNWFYCVESPKTVGYSTFVSESGPLFPALKGCIFARCPINLFSW